MKHKTIVKKLRREQFRYRKAQLNTQNPSLSNKYNNREAELALNAIGYLQGLLRHTEVLS